MVCTHVIFVKYHTSSVLYFDSDCFRRKSQAGDQSQKGCLTDEISIQDRHNQETQRAHPQPTVKITDLFDLGF